MINFEDYCINKLPRLHRDIMIMHYGLDGKTPRSSEEIAESFNEVDSAISAWHVDEVIAEANQILGSMDPSDEEYIHYARKVVIENTSKLAGKIEIINPLDNEIKPFQKLAFKLK